MFTLYLKMMDISLEVKSPFEFIIYDSIKPFLVPFADSPCVKIIYNPVGYLPEPEGGRWIEDCYFCDNRFFLRNLYNLPPYAMVESRKDSIVCNYLPEFEHYVNSTGSLLNLVGMESVFLKEGGFMIHASFIRVGGKGILFTAPCGVGKSTQASLWEQVMDAEILNGDRAGIRFVDGIWTAYGMPFAGTSGIYCNESAPVSAIVALAQGPENVVSKLRTVQSMTKLLPEINCRRWDSSYMNQLLNTVQDMLTDVPVYYLSCRPDADAVYTLHNVLLKEGLL